MSKTVLSKKTSITITALYGGPGATNIVWTVHSHTCGTLATLTGMMLSVFGVVPLLTEMTIIRAVNKTRKRGTSIVMMAAFDQTNLVGSLWSFENKKEGLEATHDKQLIVRREDLLKLFQFFQTTGPFGDACQSVKVFGFLFLRRTSCSHILVPILSYCTLLTMAMSPHGDLSPGAT